MWRAELAIGLLLAGFAGTRMLNPFLQFRTPAPGSGLSKAATGLRWSLQNPLSLKIDDSVKKNSMLILIVEYAIITIQNMAAKDGLEKRYYGGEFKVLLGFQRRQKGWFVFVVI